VIQNKFLGFTKAASYTGAISSQLSSMQLRLLYYNRGTKSFAQITVIPTDWKPRR